MELNTIAFSFLLILCGLIGIIIALALAYHRVVAQFKMEYRVPQHPQQKSYKQAEEVLDKAHKEAVEIIQQATQKSSHLISQSSRFAEAQKNEIDQQMKETGEDELDIYVNSIKKAQEQVLTALGQVTDELQRSSESELTKFRQQLVQSTQETQSLFMKQMQVELTEAGTSVTAYKKTLLEKADRQMFTVVQQVVQEVLHKSLTKNEHEALVIEALEEAKKHHVI